MNVFSGAGETRSNTPKQRKKILTVLVQYASLVQRTGCDRRSYDNFSSTSFLGAVSNSSSNSELESLKGFPDVEKQLYILSKFSELLFYRLAELRN